MQKGNKKMYNLIIRIEHCTQRKINISQNGNMKATHDNTYMSNIKYKN